MEISVQGTHREWVRPELGRLHASARAEAHSKDEVLRRVTDVVTAFSAELDRLRGTGAVTEVVVAPITTSSWRPSARGKLLPAQFTADCTLRADFADLDALADVVVQAGVLEGLNLHAVEWRLTDATRDRIEGECLTKAVVKARERALVMAAAAGFGEVRFLQLADPGLLASEPVVRAFGGAPEASMMRSAKAEMDLQGISIQPEELRLEASVQARFLAD